jgi:hypothetical protein
MRLPQVMRCMHAEQREHQHAGGAPSADACGRVFTTMQRRGSTPSCPAAAR